MKLSETIIHKFGDDHIKDLISKIESHRITQNELDEFKKYCMEKWDSIRNAHSSQQSHLYDLYQPYFMFGTNLSTSIEDLHTFHPVEIDAITQTFRYQPSMMTLACSCGKIKYVEVW
jgi:hypothetical protein